MPDRHEGCLHSWSPTGGAILMTDGFSTIYALFASDPARIGGACRLAGDRPVLDNFRLDTIGFQ
jgi:hypothetical protein